jgi:DNA-binding GntR family transcriptional regulator
MENTMRTTLAKKAYDQIKFDIITCAYEPGQQIAQPQLVEKYEYGITPIREALHQLAQEGFLQPIPRFGYIIIPISIPDVNQIYELRAILEPAAAHIAAEVASDEALENLIKSADFSYIPGDRQSIIDFVNKNARFHLSFAIATGNRRLVEAISRMLDEMARIFFLGLNFSKMSEEVRAEHQAIATAISNRDPDKAEQTSREEIVHSKARIMEVLRNRWEKDFNFGQTQNQTSQNLGDLSREDFQLHIPERLAGGTLHFPKN